MENQAPDQVSKIAALTTSIPLSLRIGTGASIYTNALIPAILSAKHEVILVTCFWAPSKSLSALRDALERLSARRHALILQGHTLPPLRISLCFSSRSLFQKLSHTASPDGYVYPPSSWPKKLGLPAQATLEAGHISLTAKSLFFLPFSVLHPKFVIIDRERAFLPSCNISWEAWLEGCVEISGPAIRDLLAFYSSHWDKTIDPRHGSPAAPATPVGISEPGLVSELEHIQTHAHYAHSFPPSTQTAIATAILPSPYCRNPRFRPFPWQAAPAVPASPLNTSLLRLFDEAKNEAYIQTPNLTCAPVISALLAALQRGINVNIVTSRGMMLLEQLVTAGTTTSWRLRSMIRRYRAISGALTGYSRQASRVGRGTRGHRRLGSEDRDALEMGTDVEAQNPGLGRLSISYFRPREESDLGPADETVEEPVHSHFKLTIVDGRHVVLGSGNMDRASWYTSQELGILFDAPDFAATVKAAVDEVLEGRLELVFDSGPSDEDNGVGNVRNFV